MFENGLWAQVSDRLSRAKSAAGVLGAFEAVSEWKSRPFTVGTMPKVLLATLQDRDFPKARVDAQIKFVADSLSATGDVSPRRARQICREERRKHDADPERYNRECAERHSITKLSTAWLYTDPSSIKRG
jgi:hypothetical protein